MVVSAVGAGGMGEVYRAHDTKLGRDVALKVLPARMAADPARFRRDAFCTHPASPGDFRVVVGELT